MRDRDIVTPFGVAQDPFLYAPCLLAQHSLGRVGQHAEDDFVEHLFFRLDVVILVVLVVIIFLLSTLA